MVMRPTLISLATVALAMAAIPVVARLQVRHHLRRFDPTVDVAVLPRIEMDGYISSLVYDYGPKNRLWHIAVWTWGTITRRDVE